jgi:nucleotide-binding universal stress UspA family protein
MTTRRITLTEANKMIKHVLVAVGTKQSGTVLKTALDRARHTGAQLTAVYVIDTLPWWAMTDVDHGFVNTLPLVQDTEREVERRCNETFEREAGDIVVEAITVRLDRGNVGSKIARLADEYDADLIVVGASNATKWHFWKERMSDVIGRCTRRAVQVATAETTNGGAFSNVDARRNATRKTGSLVHTQPL